MLRPRQQPYREAHPRPEDVLLVIEVADTTRNYDRDAKIPLYGKQDIPEVWLIDVAANRLEIYRQPVEGDYRVLLKPLSREVVPLFAMDEIAVDLGRLF